MHTSPKNIFEVYKNTKELTIKQKKKQSII